MFCSMQSIVTVIFYCKKFFMDNRNLQRMQLLKAILIKFFSGNRMGKPVKIFYFYSLFQGTAAFMKYKGHDAGTDCVKSCGYSCRSCTGDNQFFHIHEIKSFFVFYSRDQRAKRTCGHVHLAAAARVKVPDLAALLA